MTASAIYSGSVRHRRLGRERPGAFEHRIALAYLDLDELPSLLGGRLVRRRPGLVRARPRDLLGAGSPAAVREAVFAASGHAAADGPVRVLAHPRVLGAAFNPVAFYYLFDTAEHLDCVLANVTSTPYGEEHSYVLRAGNGPVVRGAHDKAMHVSPFQPMDRRHHWAVTAPGDTLSVHIENHGATGTDFDATLKLARRPLTRANLARLIPSSSLRTMALIYGHALGLTIRRAPHFSHPRTTTS